MVYKTMPLKIYSSDVTRRSTCADVFTHFMVKFCLRRHNFNKTNKTLLKQVKRHFKTGFELVNKMDSLGSRRVVLEVLEVLEVWVV